MSPTKDSPKLKQIQLTAARDKGKQKILTLHKCQYGVMPNTQTNVNIMIGLQKCLLATFDVTVMDIWQEFMFGQIKFHLLPSS